MREQGERYYELAEASDFDYQAMLDQNREEVQRILDDSKATFVEANPSYEEMEGIVAGVPRLAQYDVDIDAGSDASDPENAVSFSLELPNGETLEQPGNLFFVTETALYGTNPDFLAKGVDGDVDGNGTGRVRRGRAGRGHLRRGGPRSSRSRPPPGRGRAGVRADAVRRVHRDDGDDPDDERVLRGLEELPLRRRRERDRAGFVAASRLSGHRRHPRGPGPDL